MVKFSVVNTGCYGSQMTAVNQKTHLWKTDDDVTFFPPSRNLLLWKSVFSNLRDNLKEVLKYEDTSLA